MRARSGLVVLMAFATAPAHAAVTIVAPLKSGSPVIVRFAPPTAKPALVVRALRGSKKVAGRARCTPTGCTLRAPLVAGAAYRAVAPGATWTFRAPLVVRSVRRRFAFEGTSVSWSGPATARVRVDGGHARRGAGRVRGLHDGRHALKIRGRLRTVTVSGPPQAALPTSEQIIDHAVLQGSLSPAAAATDKLYAAFGSPRLPEILRGNDRVAARAQDDLVDAAEALPAGQTAKLKAFFVPPAYPASALAHSGRARAAGATGPGGEILKDWKNVSSSAVRVWWNDAAAPKDAAVARDVLDLLVGKAWPRLTKLMDKEPISDAGVPENGGDGRFDVYVYPCAVRGDHSCGGPAYTLPYDGTCKKGPRWMFFNDTFKQSDVRLNVVAHEFFHALVAAYDHQNCAADAGWDEGTARWAETYVAGV